MAAEDIIAERPQLQKISYRKPDLRGLRGVARLGGTDIMSAYMQVLREGGRQGLHAHNNYDGVYFVLSGRVAFRGEGGAVFAEIGRNEAVIVPRGATYGFEAIGGDAEIFYVNAIDRQAPDLFISREQDSDKLDFERFTPEGELLGPAS